MLAMSTVQHLGEIALQWRVCNYGATLVDANSFKITAQTMPSYVACFVYQIDSKKYKAI